MDQVKTRKQGNSITVTIDQKFNVPEGKEYYITQEEDGTISLIPKIEDFFRHVQHGQYMDDEDALAQNFTTKGNEISEYH
ncbi:type II toxin-antitoxin system PemI/MazE family antitoxin [Staphylococcus massiliensis]|uniref:type II toxin-antitoxin system PemI/MazE family antitoxin n=1 Tax=Staphylococcus massiliensis TaxID=555791 RepID=UPI001EDE29A8|nr:AbrB family transcriptional regulator [Staphylococcus massiliensis]MCG3401962.1 AbrB family transcriptional regulator [Staphylococcus massiliensis]MCG3412374.1 AbrB family transcriptional regulator [Staphylococcus massiliensis]